MLPKLPTSLLSFLFCALFAHVSLAQQDATSQNQTLNEQYKTLIEKSETFNEYKVIKKNTLTDFWRVVSDSVRAVNKSKREALSTVKTKNAQIEDLNNTILKKDEALAAGEEEKANITVLGAEVSKSLYAVISLVIPLVLLVVIGFLIAKSRVDSVTAKTSRQNKLILEKEYEAYKKRALDIQAKLNRELQTERNKLSELKR